MNGRHHERDCGEIDLVLEIRAKHRDQRGREHRDLEPRFESKQKPKTVHQNKRQLEPVHRHERDQRKVKDWTNIFGESTGRRRNDVSFACLLLVF